jgi:glycosyltransferase involved in cell wall biosynthesis
VMLSHGGPSTAIVNGAWPERRARQLLERFRQVDLTVSVASHWAERLRALGLENVVVIPNPIDLRRFAPGPRDVELQRSLRIGPEAVVVLHASSLQAEKRPFDLVAAAEKASRQVPQLTYVVLGETMVGPRGPADVSPRREMEAACRRAGLAERFRFVGWVDHDRVREYLRLADLVVMPSEHETQSLVYLETQACGRVVVASDIPGAREVIVDGVTGLLFRRGDVADLAARIVSAARDPALRTRIGLNARQAVRTHDLGATIAAYAATLVRVAAKRPQLSPS